MYRKPTKEMVEKAIAEGWLREDAERGWSVCEGCLGLLEIQRCDMMYEETDCTDEDCAIEAAKAGIKLIPMDELPEAMGNDRYPGYVDTLENRAKIAYIVNKRLFTMEIQRCDQMYEKTDCTDDDCAIEAAYAGIKLIPKDELPEAMGEYRNFGYVDTPENRATIAALFAD